MAAAIPMAANKGQAVARKAAQGPRQRVL
jgi:hypothetical protein